MNNPQHQTSESISHCLLLKLSQSLGADEEKRKLLRRSLIISTLFAFWLKMKQVDEFSFKSVKTFDKTFLTFTTFPPYNMDVLKALKLFEIIKFFPPLQTPAPLLHLPPAPVNKEVPLNYRNLICREGSFFTKNVVQWRDYFPVWNRYKICNLFKIAAARSHYSKVCVECV